LAQTGKIGKSNRSAQIEASNCEIELVTSVLQRFSQNRVPGARYIEVPISRR